MKIIECHSDNEINATLPVMAELRPKLNTSECLSLIRSLELSEKYQLIGAFENELCIAAAGFRLKRSLFSEGKLEMYIDDFVVTHLNRSQGIGHQLFEYLKQKAKDLDCAAITLDSGLQRTEAHRFYEREGMTNMALHFRMKLNF
jgi:GNAT superfamily N-acetyltransferase